MLPCARAGFALSKLHSTLASLMTKDARIIMLGLDAAGKTTVLYKLKLNELVTTIPTVGFNVETLRYKSLQMTMWDVGGQDKIRALWRYYFENTDAVIFLVDSNDPDRLGEARDELHKLLADDLLRGARLLVIANKQDLPAAMPPDKVAAGLDLHLLRHKWFLQPASAVRGDGLYEGLDWLQRALTQPAAAGAA